MMYKGGLGGIKYAWVMKGGENEKVTQGVRLSEIYPLTLILSGVIIISLE